MSRVLYLPVHKHVPLSDVAYMAAILHKLHDQLEGRGTAASTSTTAGKKHKSRSIQSKL
jgi:hypothetical protein